jgi:hypothetical protein
MRPRSRRRGALSGELLAVAALSGVVILGSYHGLTEDGVRTAVSEARANLDALAQAIEAYRVDWGICPYDGYSATGSQPGFNYWYPPTWLTTPVAYVGVESFEDPFRALLEQDPLHWQYTHLRYTSARCTWGPEYADLTGRPGESIYLDDILTEWGEWRLLSVGPDLYYGPAGSSALFPGAQPWPGISSYPALPQPYDPTNGFVSWGDLLHSELSPVGYLNIPQPDGAGQP